jgi:hypothetical protein
MPAIEFQAEGTDFYVGTPGEPSEYGVYTLSEITAWASIGCLRSVSPNTIEREFEEREPCLNAVDRSKRKIPKSISMGQVSAKIVFSNATDDSLRTKLMNGTEVGFGYKIGDTGYARVYVGWVSSSVDDELSDGSETATTYTFEVIAEDLVADSVFA